ncbi:MAG: hypothetical protein IPG89_20295 [Bacteroidetes bacterium]|nr:hypothetical protein [Bacteroidota bacterium]
MNPKTFDLYNLSNESEKELWKECVFVFDSSVLLDFYDYPSETSKAIFTNILEKLKSRIWIPSQVQFEYLKNREAVIKKPITERYEPLKKEYIDALQEFCTKSKNKIDSLKQRTRNNNKHPFFYQDFIDLFQKDLVTYETKLSDFKLSFDLNIDRMKKEISELEKDDFVLNEFVKILRVGREYSFTEQFEISKEGKSRYDLKIPPGYEDAAEKIGIQAFGDLLIWKQIIEFSAAEHKNIVFVCNDFKMDWYIVEGKHSDKKTKGPRHELIKEFSDQTKMKFWMYGQGDFINKCDSILNLAIPKDEAALISAHISEKIKHFFKYKYFRAFRPDGSEKDGVNRIEFNLNGEELTREYVPEGFPKEFEWATIAEIDKHNIMYPNKERQELIRPID